MIKYTLTIYLSTLIIIAGETEMANRLTNTPKDHQYVSEKQEKANKAATKAGLKGVAVTLLVLILIVAAYVAYVFIDYHRLEDNIILDVEGTAVSDTVDVTAEDPYHITSWNIGFGAYTDDFSFFMDGGIYSRSFSYEDTVANLENMISELKSYNSDFYLIQEVDFDSTRSHKVDEVSMLKDAFNSNHQSTFGINYDSPYLFFPVLSPIGASNSGIMTLSETKITDSLRRSLPIQTNYAKLLDLDRCYVVDRIPLSNGKELILINFHLSAYTTDDTIVTQQLNMLFGTMTEEIARGNYVIAGGDFNMDLLQDSGSIFGVSGADYSWAQPFPEDKIPEGISLIAPLDPDDPIPSARNADSEWDPLTNFQITLDGFLVSDNIEVLSSEVTDQQFAYSDHQPVQMTFRFK